MFLEKDSFLLLCPVFICEWHSGEVVFSRCGEWVRCVWNAECNREIKMPENTTACVLAWCVFLCQRVMKSSRPPLSDATRTLGRYSPDTSIELGVQPRWTSMGCPDPKRKRHSRQKLTHPPSFPSCLVGHHVRCVSCTARPHEVRVGASVSLAESGAMECKLALRVSHVLPVVFFALRGELFSRHNVRTKDGYVTECVHYCVSAISP